MIRLDAEVLALLACPVCRAPFIAPAEADDRLTCSGCARAYPVVDGIPVLLIDEAVGGPSAATDATTEDQP